MEEAVEEASNTSPGAVRSTFIVISVANLGSAATGLLLILLNGDDLSWGSFTGGTWVSCIAMGVAVYLVAEVAWTWANTRKSAVPYTALPYLTPAISAIILSLSTGAAITPLVAAALAITLGANLIIMRRGE